MSHQIFASILGEQSSTGILPQYTTLRYYHVGTMDITPQELGEKQGLPDWDMVWRLNFSHKRIHT